MTLRLSLSLRGPTVNHADGDRIMASVEPLGSSTRMVFRDEDFMDEADLRVHLAVLTPGAREELRWLLLGDLDRRNAASEQLLERREAGAGALAGLLDLLRLDDEARRATIRILGEMAARE